MKRNNIYALIVLVIIVASLVGVYMYYKNYGEDFGKSKVVLPHNFKVKDVNKNKTELVITDGKHNIALDTFERQNVRNLVDKYNQQNNNTAEISTLNLNGTVVLRTRTKLNDSANNTMVSYWFAKDGHQYRYYGIGYPGIEDTLQQLIHKTEHNLLKF